MTDIRKIAIACFAGSALFVLVTFFIDPTFWQAAALAGLIAGYVTCEFRDVVRAVPHAFTAALAGADASVRAVVAGCSRFFSKDRPYTYIYLTIAALMTFGAYHLPIPTRTGHPLPNELVLALQSLAALYGLLLSLFIGVLFICCAGLGAHVVEKVHFGHSLGFRERPGEYGWNKLEAQGYRFVDRTYLRVLRWGIEGIVLAPFNVLQGLTGLLLVLVMLFVGVIRLVHTDKRMLCGLDGALGGSLGYWFFVHPYAHLAFQQQATAILASGILGAALGVAHWELISKRLLKLVLPAR